MKTRRAFLMSVTTGVVALAVLAAPVIAEEFFGAITKVDVAGRTLSVLTKGAKEVEIKTNDNTEIVAKKGTFKLGPEALEKIAQAVAKQQEAGKKGLIVKIEHKKGVASKITPVLQKQQQPQ